MHRMRKYLGAYMVALEGKVRCRDAMPQYEGGWGGHSASLAVRVLGSGKRAGVLLVCLLSSRSSALVCLRTTPANETPGQFVRGATWDCRPK